MKKRLGLDTSSFRKLREKDLVYVDKTKWIYKLITDGECYFLSRPRRFGKSLTISTLKELFYGNKELFKGLYIYDKWDFKKYPVLIFDFNEITNKTPKDLENSLRTLLNYYYFEVNKPEKPSSEDLSFLFKQLIVSLHQTFNQKVVILIDEYDKPIIEHLGKGEEGLRIAIQNRDILQDFFGVLKGANVVDIIQFVFVTGVSRFSKVSIFSNWNNLQDITMRGEFADFLGYTEEEVKNYFKDYVEELAKEYDLTEGEIIEKLKFYYDGYRFSKKDVRVFNPISIMYCFKNKDFSNYWFSTATPSFLVNLIKEKNYYIPDLENVELTANQLEIFDIEKIKIVPMLFQTGYLTIKDVLENTFTLTYPNQEVRTSFNEILLAEITEADEAITYATKLGKAFKNEDFEEIRYYINAIFSDIPYPHYKKADENYFHTIIYLSLTLTGYNAKSELLSSRGRLDLALIFPDKVYVIEFKCNSSAKDAIRQIKEKKYADTWKNKGIRTILCGINFDTEKKEVKEIVFEECRG